MCEKYLASGEAGVPAQAFLPHPGSKQTFLLQTTRPGQARFFKHEKEGKKNQIGLGVEVSY